MERIKSSSSSSSSSSNDGGGGRSDAVFHASNPMPIPADLSSSNFSAAAATQFINIRLRNIMTTTPTYLLKHKIILRYLCVWLSVRMFACDLSVHVSICHCLPVFVSEEVFRDVNSCPCP